MIRARHPLWAATFVLTLLFAGSAHATSQLDLVVAMKTLPLLTEKLSGNVVAGIVYDPANLASKNEANAIKSIIDAGLEAPGGIKVSGELIGVGELGKLSDVKLAFVTTGIGSALDTVGAAMAAAGVLTISTDIECVKAGKCVLAVASSPSVEIYYSKAAADAAKISFAQAFTMLIKQI